MAESTKQLTTEEAFKDGTWCAPQTSRSNAHQASVPWHQTHLPAITA